MHDSRAIRVEDWSQIREGLVKDGWQFRNLLKPKAGDSDVENVFWSSDGEPDIRQGVIYIRRQVGFVSLDKRSECDMTCF